MVSLEELGLRPELASAVAAALAVVFAVLALAARRSAARTRGSWQESERALARERDRASGLEREIRIAREGAARAPTAERIALDALARGARDLAGCASREEVAAALGRAVESALAPKQWMVFLSADREGKEFVVAASGGGPGSRAWKRGARLSSQSGLVGLAVRRRAALDWRDFEAEPPVVRDQVKRTEPADFELEIVVPVLSGSRVAAVVATGTSAAGPAIARTFAETIASVASVVLRGLSVRERAERIANEDTLTGVGTRSWFQAAAAEDLYRVRQAAGRAALVVFGIQHFQQYVRRNGVQAGDRLVRGVAQVLRPLVAEGRFLARWSTDEFVVFLPDTDLPAAWGFAATVRRAVAQVDWPCADGLPGGRVTLCAGIAGFPLSGDSLEKLVACAASTLIDARASGSDTTGSVVIEPAAAATIAALAGNARTDSSSVTSGQPPVR